MSVIKKMVVKVALWSTGLMAVMITAAVPANPEP